MKPLQRLKNTEKNLSQSFGLFFGKPIGFTLSYTIFTERSESKLMQETFKFVLGKSKTIPIPANKATDMPKVKTTSLNSLNVIRQAFFFFF